MYRGGDLVSGWIYAGLAFVGLGIGAIALVAAPAAILWTVIALHIGRAGEERAEELEEAEGAAAVVS